MSTQLRPRDSAMVARRPWKYVNAEDNFALSNTYYGQLKNAVKKYRQVNHYPIGLLFDEEFDANICRQTPEQCVDYLPPTLYERASALTKALIMWGKSGFQVRPETEVQGILNLCRNCPEYGGESGLLKIVCKKCGCSRKKIFLATAHCPLSPPKW